MVAVPVSIGADVAGGPAMMSTGVLTLVSYVVVFIMRFRFRIAKPIAAKTIIASAIPQYNRRLVISSGVSPGRLPIVGRPIVGVVAIISPFLRVCLTSNFSINELQIAFRNNNSLKRIHV